MSLNRELARVIAKKNQLQSQLQKAKSIIIQQVMAWGFFNPFWNQINVDAIEIIEAKRDDASANAELAYHFQMLSVFADEWVKVLEADRLRFYADEIPEVEAIRQMVLSLTDGDKISVAFLAHQKFEYKHPGYDSDNLKIRLTTDSLKACWENEGWYKKLYNPHVNRFKSGLSAWMFRPVAEVNRYVVFAEAEAEAKAIAAEWSFDSCNFPKIVDWQQINIDCLGKTFAQGKAIQVIPNLSWEKKITHYLVKFEQTTQILDESQLKV